MTTKEPRQGTRCPRCKAEEFRHLEREAKPDLFRCRECGYEFKAGEDVSVPVAAPASEARARR
jgi:predicted Zn-ribbon and HTH transcriptional regulator